jgi:hypothetical protein
MQLPQRQTLRRQICLGEAGARGDLLLALAAAAAQRRGASWRRRGAAARSGACSYALWLYTGIGRTVSAYDAYSLGIPAAVHV